MRAKLGVLSLLILIIMLACTMNPESKNTMIEKSNLKAINEVMGLSREGDNFTFRVFAPRVQEMDIIFYDRHDAVSGKSLEMNKKANGVWELTIPGDAASKYYCYSAPGEDKPSIADPYSRAVVRQNHFKYPTKTVILPDEAFDWGGDDFTHADLADLVIMEAHLRDMTVHESSNASQAGTYKGFVENDQNGGIKHLQDLGINAVEFLPLQEFGNIELDFKNPELSIWNDWNPYENNHWGYMTSFFFAPEIYYASDGVNTRGSWLGQDGRAVNEMKEMVKALHKSGISVIMDVVYNHVSQYDDNPFKLIDKEAYFRLDEDGNYIATSGCGNDFRTEHPMSQKMIVESLLYWMEEYHIDGFRFDLAALIDMETIDAITAATRSLNPDVLLIGEPWGGGGYNPAELADHGWASWNDHFRNSVKGRDPRPDDRGFIFGDLWDGNSTLHYHNLMNGYLQIDGGHYRQAVQSVNYLESHDDNTLGDFIRLALGKVGWGVPVTREQVAKLSPEEIKLHKFAALSLFVSQGPVMIAQGQSWGRAKVNANSIGTDPHAGHLDHNSYEKDDETNWLNWEEKALNKELVDYYRGLIAIRAQFAEIRNVETDFRSFIDSEDERSFGIQMTGDKKILVYLNANPDQTISYDLPVGDWNILADAATAVVTGKGTVNGEAHIPPQSGMILVQ